MCEWHKPQISADFTARGRGTVDWQLLMVVKLNKWCFSLMGISAVSFCSAFGGNPDSDS